MKISGKTVIITGASSGLGLACAKHLASQGANLVLMARRLERMEQIAKSLREQHDSEILCLSVDVQDKQQVQSAVDQVIKKFKNIDILLNNAGTLEGSGPIAEMQYDAFDQIIDTNIKGVLYMSRACLPTMLTQVEALIINIGSVASHLVSKRGSVYCATKHAVKAISDGLRLDLLGSNIRVSTISPGLVDVLGENEDKQKQTFYKEQGVTPLVPQDIADVIHFVISCPARVNIDEIIVMSTKQAGQELYREK